jgi:hypothetical protein
VSVVCTPFANVGQVPLATGRSGGWTPPSLEEVPLLDPLEEPLLEPESAFEPPELLAPPELLPEEPAPEELASACPEPLDPPPLLAPPASPPADEGDDPPQAAASATPSTPRTTGLRMAGTLSAASEGAQRKGATETLKSP